MTRTLIRHFVPNAHNIHDTKVRERFGVLSGVVGIVCNVFLFLLKLAVGLIAGSVSIAADAFNNLSDGLSCVISIVGFKVSGKEPDAKHPFGYGRTEYVAGLIVSFIIMLVGFEFLKTSAGRILHPETVEFSWVMLGILFATILVKLWMGAFNHHIGMLIESPVLIAAGQDSRNDVITTGVVILGMTASRFTSLPVDGYAGLFVALFIIKAGAETTRDTIAPLLGEASDPEIAANIRKIVMGCDGIVGVHDLIIHNYGVGRSLASIHAEVPSNADFIAVHELIDEAEKAVLNQTGVYLVIHMDPIDVDNARVTALRERVDSVLHDADDRLSMHDFRVVGGERQINLIFDVVVPYSYDENRKQALLNTLCDKLKEIDSRYNPVVTFDHLM